jgi:galactokinase
MSNFDDYVQAVEEGVKELAKKTLKGFKDEALSDAKEFLQSSQDDLQRWTKLLARGELSQDDFEWLVVGRKDVAELHALKQSGLAMIRLDRFRNALLDLVIDTAFDVFL